MKGKISVLGNWLPLSRSSRLRGVVNQHAPEDRQGPSQLPTAAGTVWMTIVRGVLGWGAGLLIDLAARTRPDDVSDIPGKTEEGGPASMRSEEGARFGYTSRRLTSTTCSIPEPLETARSRASSASCATSPAPKITLSARE